MQCKRCGRSIPDRALKCPYCDTRTANGWKREGEKIFIDPFKKLAKKAGIKKP